MDHSKTYKCFCNFVCKDPITFLNHEIDHKNTNPYKCFQCEYTCKEIENLETHLYAHKEVNLQKIVKDNSTCNGKVNNRLRSTSESKVKKSVKRHSRSYSENCIKKRFKCELTNCTYASKRIYDLRRHMKSHINNTVLKCHYLDN